MKGGYAIPVFLMLLLSGFSFTNAVNVNDTIYVDDDGTADYTSIQEAIDAAKKGDTVFVYSGNYHENIILDKTIFLNGEHRDSTIIDGGNQGPVIEIFSDHITISGFTIQNSKYHSNGINIYSSYNTIEHNIIQNNEYDAILLDGVYESGSFYVKPPSHNTIKANIIRNNQGKGISMWGGDIFLPRYRNIGIILNAVENTIVDNFIEYNHHGVYLAKATSKTLIDHNQFSGNDISVAPMYSRYNTITQNNFLDSEPFFQSGINEWDNNYWGETLDEPKKITGRIGYFGIIPWYNYDENPASEPFDIGGL